VVKGGKSNPEEGRGKYLPGDVGKILPPPIEAPDDSFPVPSWLVDRVREVASTEVDAPAPPPLKFDLSPEAAQHNAKVIRESHYDLERLIEAHRSSTIGYGSEFRPVEDMSAILGKHPNFKFFRGILEKGMKLLNTRDLSAEECRPVRTWRR